MSDANLLPVTINVELARVLPKLNFTRLSGPALRRMLLRCALAVQAKAMERTPVKTGTLRRSETVSVDAAPIPAWSKVGTNVVYARYIEYGWEEREGHLVMRKAGPARMFQGGLIAALPEIEAAVTLATAEIGAAWRA